MQNNRIILTSDIHFGVPNKLNDILWSARVIREYAYKNDISEVLVLGDLFHDRNSINIEVLNTAFNFFNETVEKYDQTWIALLGNHDMHLKNSWKINSVKPLSKLITVIEDVKLLNIGNARFWILPFIHFESAYMEVVKAIESKASSDDILLTHIGINNASLNECFLLKYWNLVDFSNAKFKRIYSGHFHCYQQVGANTWYPGSPIPFRFDEGLVDHGFLDFDTETCEHKFVKTFEVGKILLPNDKPAPDYITCTDEVVDEMDLTNCHVRIFLSKDYTNNELETLRTKAISRGALTIKWMKPKQEEDIIHNADIKIGDGTILFEKWLDHDKPNFDIDSLKSINKSIIDESLERLSSVEELDGDSIKD